MLEKYFTKDELKEVYEGYEESILENKIDYLERMYTL